MNKFINYLENFICGLGFLFALGSCTYCLNLIFKQYIDSKHDFIFISLVISLFITGIMINKNDKEIKEKNSKLIEETTNRVLRIYKIKKEGEN